jgi:hypothetical protein
MHELFGFEIVAGVLRGQAVALSTTAPIERGEVQPPARGYRKESSRDSRLMSWAARVHPDESPWRVMTTHPVAVDAGTRAITGRFCGGEEHHSLLHRFVDGTASPDRICQVQLAAGTTAERRRCNDRRRRIQTQRVLAFLVGPARRAV